MTDVICSAQHLCPSYKECQHGIPHKRIDVWCGRSVECKAPGVLCSCVPVVDGAYYKTMRRVPCKFCNGNGYHDVADFHAIPEDENDISSGS